MWRYLYTGDVWKLMTHQLNPMVRMLFMELRTKVSARTVCANTLCVLPWVWVIVCAMSAVTWMLSPLAGPHLFPSYRGLKTSTWPASCRCEQAKAAQRRPDEHHINEMKHPVQWLLWLNMTLNPKTRTTPYNTPIYFIWSFRSWKPLCNMSFR